jgi:DNA invertase Pin-like site-specific DNA recombinase
MASQATKFVSYLRVSTARQGRSGLGLEAQREAVRQFVTSRSGKIIAPEFVEVETGKRNDRPQLEKALKRCRVTGATLVIAKLDRLSRNAAFVMKLQEDRVRFVAADMPEANETTVGIMAVIAKGEAKAISERTKAALAAAKARGTVLGGKRKGAADISRYQAKGVQAAQDKARRGAEEFRDALEALVGERLSLNGMAARLNEDEFKTSRGNQWSAMTVKRTLALLEMDA